MKKYVQLLLYTIYAAAVFGVFLYFCFPGESIRRQITHRIEQGLPGWEIAMGGLSPLLPPGLRMDQVVISQKGQPLVAIERIEIRPTLLTLFPAQTAFHVNGRARGGVFQAIISLMPEADLGGALSISTEITLNAIQSEQFEALKKNLGIQMSGPISGVIRYKKHPKNGESGDAQINIAPCQVRLDLPVVDVKELTFAQVDATLSLQNNRHIEISEMAARGNQINADAKGSVIVNIPISKSNINISGSLKPHPSFMAKLGSNIMMLLPQSKSGNGAIPFRIKGALEAPKFSLK